MKPPGQVKPHLNIIKIIIDSNTKEISMEENLNDPKKLYHIFVELANLHKPKDLN